MVLQAEISAERLKSIGTVKRLTECQDFNLYSIDILYDYDIERVINYGITDDKTMVQAILNDALPGVEIDMTPPNFGCSAFTMTTPEQQVLMGREYDFRYDTSALMVRCHPKNGYRSIAFAALDNVQANRPEDSERNRLACLTGPYICLDGINEKGVSVAVLTLDSPPTNQSTGKPKIETGLVIRLVLDRASTTQEAVELLQQYDMFAAAGRDYHFYICDAQGDGRVVEYDPEQPDRPMIVTTTPAVTNFFITYKDRVLPNQQNGVYGHGRERYDEIMRIIDRSQSHPEADAWEALRKVAHEPDPHDITSNTQWAVVFNNTKCTADFVLRRHWDDVISFEI